MNRLIHILILVLYTFAVYQSNHHEHGKNHHEYECSTCIVSPNLSHSLDVANAQIVVIRLPISTEVVLANYTTITNITLSEGILTTVPLRGPPVL